MEEVTEEDLVSEGVVIGDEEVELCPMDMRFHIIIPMERFIHINIHDKKILEQADRKNRFASPWFFTKKDEKAYLEGQVNILKYQLAQIKKRLEEQKKQKKEIK